MPLVQCGHFSDDGGESSSYEDVQTFCCKNLNLFENYVVSTGTKSEGVKVVWIFMEKESIFP